VPFPWHPQPLNNTPGSALGANTFLRDHAERLFEARVSGAESVAVRGDGTLVMLDKYGQVWEAKVAAGSNRSAPAYELSAAPVASLQTNGGGRPLGFHPDDTTGDLYVCDSRRGLIVVEGEGEKEPRRVRDVATTISAKSRSRGGERIPYANDLDLTHVPTSLFAAAGNNGNKGSSSGGGRHTKQASANSEKPAAKRAWLLGGGGGGKKKAGNGSHEPHEPVVFFTSCTDIDPPYNAKGGFYDTMRGYQLDLAQGAPKGALLAWSPSLAAAGGKGEGGAVVVAEGFYYANGVALSKDGDYALVVETNRNRVLRVWLDGRLGGQQGAPSAREADVSGPGGPGATLAEGFRVAPRIDIFADDLPGVPDGVNIAGASRHFGDEEGDAFWVALIGPVPPISKLLGLAGVRAIYAWLPERMRPTVKPWGAALRLRAADGEAETLLLDPAGERVSSVSAVTESEDGLLFFGNLMGDYVSYVDLRTAGEWRRRSAR
jgi:hypothetical protein